MSRICWAWPHLPPGCLVYGLMTTGVREYATNPSLTAEYDHGIRYTTNVPDRWALGDHRAGMEGYYLALCMANYRLG